MNTKIPPHSEEAERGLIGSVLMDYERVLGHCVEIGLVPDAFYVPSNRIVYEAALEIHSTGRPVELIVLGDKLKTTGQLDLVGGRSALEALIDACPTSAHAAHYASIVTEKAKLRSIIESSRQAIDDCYKGDEPAAKVASKSASDLLEISRVEGSLYSPDQQLENAERLWYDALGGKCPGIPSRWLPFENLIGGYKPKQNIVIGARPSCGKTIIMLNECEHAATLNEPVGIYSLEMSEEDLRERMACARANSSTFRLARGHANEDEIKRSVRAWKEINKLPIYICDRRSNINAVESWMTMAYEKWGIKKFWLDYLTLIEDHTGGKGDWVRIVGECAARIKERGKRLGISTCILAQFSRTGHKTEGENTESAPTLEALRDSGEIEQHADIVALVYKKPDMPTHTFSGDNDWPMEWNVAKNRKGPTDRIPMVMVRKEQRYVTQAQHADMVREKNMQK